MRIGISTPLVIDLPGASSLWEASASVDDLVSIARDADALGFHHLTCSEHIAVPSDIAAVRGGTYWDPVATLSFLAAHTERIALATSVVVLGYHHPLAIVKRYGTLDRLSGGRVVLGVGVGSLEEEFTMLGVPFEGRGAIADDMLAALRASLSTHEASYHGPHFSFHNVVVEPHAMQEHVPIWVGGRTPRSLRRARDLGDGWVPFGLAPDQLSAVLRTVEIPEGFQVVLSPSSSLDPLAAPDAALEHIQTLFGAGATIVNVRLKASSATHYREQLDALANLVPLTD